MKRLCVKICKFGIMEGITIISCIRTCPANMTSFSHEDPIQLRSSHSMRYMIHINKLPSQGGCYNLQQQRIKLKNLTRSVAVSSSTSNLHKNLKILLKILHNHFTSTLMHINISCSGNRLAEER